MDATNTFDKADGRDGGDVEGAQSNRKMEAFDEVPLDMPLAYPPETPSWVPGKPGFLARRLMRIAGCDLSVALELPADEQQQLKRVGLGVIFGALFQFTIILVSLIVAFTLCWWTIFVSAIITGILYVLDAKIVAADWLIQGRALCRSAGLLPSASWREKLQRPLSIAGRFAISGVVAFTLAVFLLLAMFKPAIIARWAEENLAQNRPFVEAAAKQLQPRIQSQEHELALADVRIAETSKASASAAQATAPSTEDIDGQLRDRSDRLRRLEAEKSAAQVRQAEEQRSVRAEQWGVKDQPKNSGHKGKGDRWKFYSDRARDEREAIEELDVEIEASNKQIAYLRAERIALLDRASRDNRARLEAIERRSTQEVENRSRVANELDQLRAHPQEWIDAQARNTPGYVSMPNGIIAELEALGYIVLNSVFIASVVFFVKIVIIVLECAGPISKLLFTGQSVYALRIALRLHDAVESEVDRRTGWDHWRLVRRDRSREAMDAVRRRQDQRHRMNKSYNDIFATLQAMR
jgi:hypothetical protein